MKKLFLSHSSIDKAFVRQLAADLSAFGIPSWIDEAEIAFGDLLISKIQQSIEAVAIVLVVISKNSVISDWVKTELELALSLEINGKKNFVVGVVIDDIEIPIALQKTRYLDCRTPRNYKLNVGAFVEILKSEYHPQYLTAGQALNVIKSQCEYDGNLIAVSQQGLSQIVTSQHVLLRNLIYRDAHMGVSRFWVFELYLKHLKTIRTITVVDGKMTILPDRAIQGWATTEQMEGAKFEITSFDKAGNKSTKYAYRTTDFKPEAVALSFTDSNSIYKRLLEQVEPELATLLYGGFATMMFYHDNTLKQFVWSIQFFDAFSTNPIFYFISDARGNLLQKGISNHNSLINQEMLWFSFDNKQNVRGKLALNLIDHITERNKGRV